MKALIFLATFLISNAFAVGYQTVDKGFTIFSNFGGGQVFYNCDSVENKVEDLLKEMGAKNISVRCSGGLDRFGRFSTSARVRTSFDVLSYEAPNDGTLFSTQTVEVRERGNCHLYNSSFKALSKSFEMSDISTRSCFRPSDRTRISFKVLKE